MIGSAEANTLIRSRLTQMQPITCTLPLAAGCILAEEVIAPYDIPAFPQASMDGYALAYSSLGKPIRITGEIAAGSQQAFQLPPGEAMRIFTGAPVPTGADTIIVGEKARTKDGLLALDDHPIQLGQHVRPVGSETKKGALALQHNTKLTPAAIGFLAGMGVSLVKVIPLPKVAILVTGNELIAPGRPLEYGQVYESNSTTLTAVLQQIGIYNPTIYTAKDDPDALTANLKEALRLHDMVLMTGGVSVGDYDFTIQAFKQAGVEIIFHKIRQKPGKPLLFGMAGEKPVFGLPGNPASVLTCFYMYVSEAIALLAGIPVQSSFIQGTLMSSYQKPAGMTHFLKALLQDGLVTLLEGQESYKLHSFAIANALAVLPEPTTDCTEGDTVNVYRLPS